MWSELGIPPSDDPKAIRRAYAACLKGLDQDRDPEAFVRLRVAFEWALAEANGAPASSAARTLTTPERDPNAEEDEEDSVVPAHIVVPDAAWIEPDTENLPIDNLVIHTRDRHRLPLELPDDRTRDRALLVALDTALERRDAAEAARLCYRASATGALPLRNAPEIFERLFAVSIEDPQLDRTAFCELARCFGWDRPALQGSAGSDASELRERVLSRLSAEDWYDSLVASADRKKGTPRRKVKVARLMLARIGRRWTPRVDKLVLRTCLEEYRTHEIWLRDRISPAWASKLENRLRRREIRKLGLMSLFLAAMLVNSVRVFVIEFSEGTLSAWYALIGLVLAAILLWPLKSLLTELARLLTPRSGS